MTDPKVGILMLDTRFPRYVGDVGNPDSFVFPVAYGRVEGATPQAIVREDPRPWTNRFLQAGQELVAQGCSALATTCGFLTLVRDDVAAACGVPVVSSALELVPDLIAAGETPGILTISAQSLSPAHLDAGRVPRSTPVHGVDGGHFARAILGNERLLDPETSETELVAGAKALCTAHPDISTIVLECTNMPPHAARIEDATGRRTVSILTAINRLHESAGSQ